MPEDPEPPTPSPEAPGAEPADEDTASVGDMSTEASPVVEMPAVLQPAVTVRERLWPASFAGRLSLVAGAVALTVWTVVVQVMRYAGMFNPWAADGDQPQAVFQYWRYHIEGAFPAGDLITDYAFVMHAPPVWWAMMAGLSTFIEPLLAAKVLNLFAYLLTCIAMWFAVARRSNAFVGLAAVALLVRNWDFSYIIAGGYARSFGPLLTVVFFAAWSAQRHRLVLAILVLQAALYPSVVIPCGLAYGAYTVLAGPMAARLRRMAGMLVAGLLIIAFGKFQDLSAPASWGTVVTLEEAKAMPAWGPGGRVAEVPLRPFFGDLGRHFRRAFHPNGHQLAPRLATTLLTHSTAMAGGLASLAAVAAGLVFWQRRRRRGAAAMRPIDDFPWQLAVMFGTAFLSYVLARQLAFRLYVPYRPLQHVWPYVVYMGIPLLWWSVTTVLVRQRSLATILTVVLAIVPMFAVFGTGLDKGPRTYGIHAAAAPLFQWIRTTPLTKVFAGDIGVIDNTPLFSYHTAFMTKNLAHPFRKGYYDEAERRLRETYTSLYATSLADVAAFGAREQVDYLIVRNSIFKSVDTRLFRPLRSQLDPVFRRNSKKGFALKKIPAEAIAWEGAGFRVVDLAALAKVVAALPVAGSPPPPPPTAQALEGLDDADADAVTGDDEPGERD